MGSAGLPWAPTGRDGGGGRVATARDTWRAPIGAVGGGGLCPAAGGHVRWRQGKFLGFRLREKSGDHLFIGRGS